MAKISKEVRHRKQMEKVRLRAGRLFERGRGQKEVAVRLGVAPQRVNDWHTAWKTGGLDALRSKGPVGAKPRLDADGLNRVEQALKQGPRSWGFDTDYWTLDRIAAVIERVTGWRFHIGHLTRLLRRKLGWSLQRPVGRPRQRSEEAIGTWRTTTWVKVRKKGA